MKRLIVFDLDGTLAQSKSSLDAEMAMLPVLALFVLFQKGFIRSAAAAGIKG